MKSRAFDDAGEGDDDCGGGDIGGVGLAVTRKQMDGNAQKIWVTRAKQVKDEYIFSTIPLRFTFLGRRSSLCWPTLRLIPGTEKSLHSKKWN